jgi:hypothetical protein
MTTAEQFTLIVITYATLAVILAWRVWKRGRT